MASFTLYILYHNKKKFIKINQIAQLRGEAISNSYEHPQLSALKKRMEP